MLMVSTNEIVNAINSFSLSERIKIIEAVLRNIREEKIEVKTEKEVLKNDSPIGKFVGILNEEEATIFEQAVQESRKIDKSEW